MPIPKEILGMLGDDTALTADSPALRALADMNGNLGESWLMLDGDAVQIFSKRVGDNFQQVMIPLDELKAMELEDDRPFCFCTFVTSDETNVRLKFASHDSEALQALRSKAGVSAKVIKKEIGHDSQAGSDTVDAMTARHGEHTLSGAETLVGQPKLPPRKPGTQSIKAPNSGSNAPAKPNTPKVKVDALLGFCAALQLLTRIDGSIAPEEMYLVHRALDNTELVARGIEYLQEHDVNALIEDLNNLMDGDQKLCLMANLLEIAMVDGYLRKEERNLLELFRVELDVKEENYKAIYDVLMIKNNLSIIS